MEKMEIQKSWRKDPLTDQLILLEEKKLPIAITKICDSYALNHYGVKSIDKLDICRDFCENDKYYGIKYYTQDTVFQGSEVLEEGEGWSVKQVIGYDIVNYFNVAIRKSDGKVIVKTEVKKTECK